VLEAPLASHVHRVEADVGERVGELVGDAIGEARVVHALVAALPVGRQVRHRGCIAAAVVVEHDDHAPAVVAEVVERLVGHAAGHRAVADDGHDVPVVRRAGVACHRHAVGVRQDRRRMAVLDEVVPALLAARVAGQPVGLAELVNIALRPVTILCTYAWWPVSQRIASSGDSNTRCRASDSSTAPRFDPEVPGVPRDRFDDEVADLAGEFVHVGVAELPQVGGFADVGESHDDATLPLGTEAAMLRPVRSGRADHHITLRPHRTRRARHGRQQRHRPRHGRGSRRPRRQRGHLGNQP
jgi:hypothetical protein